MKDIKFRYWDPFNQMMFRSEVTHLADFFRDYELALYGDNNPTLMQFTGLQDTNGRDIYEGDILASHMGKLTVVFDYGEFIGKMDDQPGRWPYIMQPRFFPQVKIIGNVYETAETEEK